MLSIQSVGVSNYLDSVCDDWIPVCPLSGLVWFLMPANKYLSESVII